MATSPAPPHELPLRELELACREQTRRYRAQASSDERYCLEIFHRALRRHASQDGSAGSPPVYHDEDARELLVSLYTDYIHAQINRKVRNLSSIEDVIQDVWRSFWMAANAKALAFLSLGAALAYLRMTTLSVAIRHIRSARNRSREESLQAIAEQAGEPLLGPASDLFDEHARRRFRECCYDRLADPVDRQIFYLRFGLGHTPQAIARWLNEHLEGRSVEYTPRRVSDNLERSFRTLSADPEIRDLLQSD